MPENDEGQRITLEDEGRTITCKAAAIAFANGYETEINTNIPLARRKEVRAEERDRTKTGAHDIMHNDIAMPKMTKSTKKLKKKKSPVPDNITNEMLQDLGNSSLGTRGHIQS
jgi:hypothetical protein